MKILFMGTPDFAVGCFRALCENGFDVVAAVSQPDRPKGRGHKMQKTPVHEYADERGIEIYQMQSIKNGELMEVLESKKPDVIVVVAYGQILPEYVLNFPKYGCINVHASLLPKYRGAAPIQRCIIDGEKVTGVTTMYMEKGLDTGDMILKKQVDIDDEETSATLHDKLMQLGAQAIVETLNMVKDGSAKAQKQNDEESTYAAMITKQTALIDWNKSAAGIVNLVRAMIPYPYAYTYLGEKVLKIGKAAIGTAKKQGKCGSVIVAGRDEIVVSCADGSVSIKSVQLEGKKMMDVRDFLSGHAIDEGMVFGKE